MNRSLRSIQEQFLTDVIIGGKELVSDSYLPRGGFSGEDLIGVYRNNYILSLTGALSATYSAVKRLVGEDFFTYIAKDFIQQHPLSSGYLNDFGDEFATFLENNESCRSLPYLSSIAQLERYYEKAYHSAEKPAYDLSKLSALENTEGGLYIEVHPSVHLIESSFPVVDIWLMDEQSTPPDLNDNAQKAIIYRYQYKVQVELIQDDEYLMLRALLKNNFFDEVYAEFQGNLDMQSFLIKYIDRQVFVNFNRE